MKKETIILYVLIALMAVAIVWTVSGLLNSQNYYGTNYQKAIASEDKSNICATPPGYTDEEWKEHMGHHPDQYAQCLKG